MLELWPLVRWFFLLCLSVIVAALAGVVLYAICAAGFFVWAVALSVQLINANVRLPDQSSLSFGAWAIATAIVAAPFWPAIIVDVAWNRLRRARELADD